jgi:hypothetical protein
MFMIDGWLNPGFGLLLTGITGVLTVLALKGKDGMFVLGFLIRIVWVIGAIRLAKPNSVWARTFYDQGKLAESARRFPNEAPRARPSIVSTRPPVPREVNVATAFFVGTAVLALFGPADGLLAGPLLVFAALARRGVGWAKSTSVVLAAVLAAGSFILGILVAVRTGDAWRVAAAATRLVLVLGAVRLLDHAHSRAYFADVALLRATAGPPHA